MKKLMSLVLLAGAAAPLFAAAPTLVDLAKKAKSADQARSYIKEAIADPNLKDNAETYYIAGKIEFDAYNDGLKAKLINPEDPAASVEVLGPELLAGYNYFLEAIPLDAQPNEKGQVKPKYTKDIMNKIKGYQTDFFDMGTEYYNKQKFFPEAYDFFMIYGNLPETLNDPQVILPQNMATAFYYGGLSAYQGNAYDQAAQAFKKARLAGYEEPEATIYEIASWQQIAQNDSVREKESLAQIKDAAQFGINKFGLEKPIFLTNLINSMVSEGDLDGSIALLNNLISENPDNASLYGLRGFVYTRAENDDLSEADYRKAASLPNVDFDTLKFASNKLFRVGTEKLNEIEGNSAEANAARQAIKNNYFIEAQNIAKKAKEMDPNDPVVDSLLESIDYALTTYFQYTPAEAPAQ